MNRWIQKKNIVISRHFAILSLYFNALTPFDGKGSKGRAVCRVDAPSLVPIVIPANAGVRRWRAASIQESRRILDSGSPLRSGRNDDVSAMLHLRARPFAPVTLRYIPDPSCCRRAGPTRKDNRSSDPPAACHR